VVLVIVTVVLPVKLFISDLDILTIMSDEGCYGYTRIQM